MVGHAPINSECFINEVGLDESILKAHEVRGLADAPDKLESRKIPAQKLFPESPATAKLRMKPDWRAFNFPPGRTTSEWLSSDNIDWSVMKANNLNAGLYDVAEHETIGITPWSARLIVNPTADPAEASVHIVGIPRPKTQLGSLPGTASGDGSTGYPVVLLGTFRASFAGQLDAHRKDGLPFYPVLVNRGVPGEMVMPDHSTLRTVMRGVWSMAYKPNCLPAAEWVTATAGPREPNQELVTADWAWPPAEGQEEEEDSGELLSCG